MTTQENVAYNTLTKFITQIRVLSPFLLYLLYYGNLYAKQNVFILLRVFVFLKLCARSFPSYIHCSSLASSSYIIFWVRRRTQTHDATPPSKHQNQGIQKWHFVRYMPQRQKIIVFFFAQVVCMCVRYRMCCTETIRMCLRYGCAVRE